MIIAKREHLGIFTGDNYVSDGARGGFAAYAYSTIAPVVLIIKLNRPAKMYGGPLPGGLGERFASISYRIVISKSRVKAVRRHYCHAAVTTISCNARRLASHRQQSMAAS